MGEYEIRIGDIVEDGSFSAVLPLRFDSLPEIKTSLQTLADIVLGYGNPGSALLIVKVKGRDDGDNDSSVPVGAADDIGDADDTGCAD